MNSKIVIIYGVDDLKRGIQAGQIENLGDINSNDLHIACLLNYIKKYSDISPFNQLNDRHSPETVSFYLNKLMGHIVFFNTTKHIQKYGKTGLFFMPDKITDIQKDTLYKFAETINDYFVVIGYDTYVSDGILSGKEMSSIEKQIPSELLNSYFEKTKNKQM